MALPVIVARTSSSSGGLSVNTLNVALPAGTVADSFLLIMAGGDSTGVPVITATNFTERAFTGGAAPDCYISALTGNISELQVSQGYVTVNSTLSSQMFGFSLRITGANETTPINGTPKSLVVVKSTVLGDEPSIDTTTIDDCLLVSMVSGDGGDMGPWLVDTVSGTEWDAATEYQEQSGTTGNDACGAYATLDWPTAVRGPSYRWTSLQSDGIASAVFAIAPSTGPADLTATTGSYTITGKSAGMSLPSPAGSYSVSGQTANLGKTFVLSVETDSYLINDPEGGAPDVNLYYFDANVSLVELDNGWASNLGAFDGSLVSALPARSNQMAATPSFSSLSGIGYSGPVNSNPIDQVRVRLYGRVGNTGVNELTHAAIYDDTTLLGECVQTNTSDAWGDYVTLSAPAGGWTYAKLDAVKCTLYTTADSGGTWDYVQQIEIEVTDTGSFVPTDISGCVQWLDAADRGVTALQWDDKSGQANHITAGSAAAFPSFANGIATFDGTDILGGGLDFSALTEGEIFCRLKIDDEGVNNGLWEYGTSGVSDHHPYGTGIVYHGFGSTVRYECGDPATALDEWHNLNIHSATNDWAVKINGAVLNSETTNTVAFTTATVLGSSADTHKLSGQIENLVLFDHKLTPAERAQMEAWIADPDPLPIEFVGSSGYVEESGSDHVLAKPAGVVEGDLLIFAAQTRNSYLELPTGGGTWILVTEYNVLVNTITPGNTENEGFRLWYKFAGASEPASYTVGVFNDTANAGHSGQLQAFRNVVSIGDWEIVTGDTPASITMVEGDALFGYTGCSYSVDNTIVVPAGMTEQTKYWGSTLRMGSQSAYELDLPAGPKGGAWTNWFDYTVTLHVQLVSGVVVVPLPTYYFDASVAGPTDDDSAWDDPDIAVFDGSIITSAGCSTNGTVDTEELRGTGSTAPASGDPITQVRARIYGGVYVSDGNAIYLEVLDTDHGYQDGTQYNADNGVWIDDNNMLDGNLSTYAYAVAASSYLRTRGNTLAVPATGLEGANLYVRVYMESVDGVSTIPNTSNIYSASDLVGVVPGHTSTTPSWTPWKKLNVPPGGWTRNKFETVELNVRASGPGEIRVYSIEWRLELASLGIAENTIDYLTGGWGDYVVLTPPAGGWTWAKLNTIEAVVYGSSGGGGWHKQAHSLELEVTVETPAGRDFDGSADLIANRLIEPAVGSYVKTGEASNLVYTQGAWEVDAGSYSITGEAVAFLTGATLSVDAGSYSINDASGGGFVPTDVSNMLLWLDTADAGTLWQESTRTTQVSADGQEVGAWDDKSGNANHWTNSEAGTLPLYKENFNTSHAGLLFDGVDTYLDGVMSEAANDWTILIVCDSNLNTDYLIDFYADRLVLGHTSTLFGFYDGEWSTGLSPTSPAVITARFDSSNSTSGTIELNRVETVASDYTQKALGGQQAIGARSDINSNNWDGYVASVLIYEGNVSEIDIASIENYLADRYGIAGFDPVGGGFDGSADLIANRLIEPAVGDYPLLGEAANLLPAEVFQVDAGSYSITGVSVDFKTDGALQADAGSYSINDASDSFVPSNIAGLELWYDSLDLSTLWTDDGSTQVANPGDLVYRWDDKSGNGGHAKQPGTSTLRPSYQTAGILFDGDDWLYNTLHVPDDRQITIFAVFSTTANTSQAFASLANPGTIDEYSAVRLRGTPAGVGAIQHRAITSYFASSASAYGDGNTHIICGQEIAADSRAVWVDGGDNGTDTNTSGDFVPSDFSLGRISDNSPANYVDGYLMAVVVYDTALNTTDRQTVENYLGVRYSVAGFDPVGFDGSADLIANRLIEPAVGNYPLLGEAANLLPAEVFQVDAGSYSITGVSVDFKTDGALQADAGVYTVTGEAAAFQYKEIYQVDTGSYAVSGDLVAFLIARTVPTDAGSYAITGAAVDFKTDGSFQADTGVYTISGEAAAFQYKEIYPVDAGSYAVSGEAANLLPAKSIAVSAGAYVVSGEAATLGVSFLLGASVGSYAVTGESATLDNTRSVEAAVGAYAITGADADLEPSRLQAFTVDIGQYIVSGVPNKFKANLYTPPCVGFSFKREAVVYIVHAGLQYTMSLSEINFNQTFQESSYSIKTLHNANMFEQSVINKANPANFDITFPAIREDDLRILFDRALDYDVFDMYVESVRGNYKIENCVITNANFIIEKMQPLSLGITGEAAKVSETLADIPGTPVARSSNMTYNRISDLDVSITGTRDMKDALTSVSVELQNEVTWTPYTNVHGALKVVDSSNTMYPSGFTLKKRVLAGTFSKYLLDTESVDLFKWNKNTSMHIYAGQQDSGTYYGFDLDIANCSYTNRIGTGEVFTQSFDWRMTQNPSALSSVITYTTA